MDAYEPMLERGIAAKQGARHAVLNSPGMARGIIDPHPHILQLFDGWWADLLGREHERVSNIHTAKLIMNSVFLTSLAHPGRGESLSAGGLELCGSLKPPSSKPDDLEGSALRWAGHAAA